MYTAKIVRTDTIEDKKKLLVDVEYYNDGVLHTTEQLEFSFDTTQDQVSRRIKYILENFDKKDATLSLITLGDVDLSSVADVAPTQDQIDQDKWFKQIDKLRKFQELKALGGMPANWQTDLDALAIKVQTDAKKSYLASL
jgi:hypothetical protein